MQQRTPLSESTPVIFLKARLVAPMRSTLSWLRWLWRNTVSIAFRADEDHVFMLAAAIAFNFITALVPTVLLILFVLGFVLDSDEVIKQLNQYAENVIVATDYRNDVLETIRSQVSSLVENRGLAGIFGIIGLLWAASALATSIRVAVNKVLRCREVRHYLIYKLLDMSTIALIGILVFASILLGPLLHLLLATSDRIGSVLHLSAFQGLVSEAANFVITLALFYVIFRYTPYQKQERHIVWIGTLTSTALWQIARYLFSFYLVEFGTFTRVYGAYAFFAATALWLYYSALVFLLGAEVAYHIKQSRWNARRLFNKMSREAILHAEGNGSPAQIAVVDVDGDVADR